MTDTSSDGAHGNVGGWQAAFVEQVSIPGTFVVAVTVGRSIDLAWTAVPGAICYQVFCGLTARTLAPSGTTTATIYSIDHLRVGESYCVQVIAWLSSDMGVASVTDDGSGSLVATQTLRWLLSCAPLASDVCYQMIQFDSPPLHSESATPGGGSPQPYKFDYNIDWGDDAVCGFDIFVTLNYAVFLNFNQLNVPTGVRKQRLIRIGATWFSDQFPLLTFSSSALGGDPLPDVAQGAWRYGGINITITSECDGRLSCAVEYIPAG